MAAAVTAAGWLVVGATGVLDDELLEMGVVPEMMVVGGGTTVMTVEELQLEYGAEPVGEL